MRRALLGRLAIALALLGETHVQASEIELHVRPVCQAEMDCFTSISAALDRANSLLDRSWINIRVAPGHYFEKPTIRRDRVRLIGSGAIDSVLSFNAVAETSKIYNRAGWGTAGSATLTIDSKDVDVSGLTVRNDYEYLANDRLADGNPTKIHNPQAVALLLDIHSDRVAIRNSALIGYQDTLFSNAGRAYISDSLISGNVDFIFGNGMLLIERSEIRSRVRSAINPGSPQSFIAAPSTLLEQPIGIVFYRSRLTRETGVPDNSVALARPWHPTMRFPDGRYANPSAVGQVSFLNCYMDRHISRDHWATMNGTSLDGTMSTLFHPQDSRFFEMGSYGPGAQSRDVGMPLTGVKHIRQVRRIIFADWRMH